MTIREEFISSLKKSGLSYARAAEVTGVDSIKLKKWKLRCGEPWPHTADGMAMAIRTLDAYTEKKSKSVEESRAVTLPPAEWERLKKLAGRRHPSAYLAALIRSQMVPWELETVPEVPLSVWQANLEKRIPTVGEIMSDPRLRPGDPESDY
jgi:hypothetical protein